MVPVLDKNKQPLMPCSEKRARRLMEKREAKPFWNKGFFCIILQKEPSSRNLQKICIGVDPGSKMSGYTVKSFKHTLLNLQVKAPTHVKAAIEQRKIMRRSRRQRNTPYRKCRFNRSLSKRLPPSTRSRWLQHLNIVKLTSKMYPIKDVVVEDIKAKTLKGKRKYNVNFSPLEVGKSWFYDQIKLNYNLTLFQGFDTSNERKRLSLKKTSKKLDKVFEAHAVDSWCLCNLLLTGNKIPENTRFTYLEPLVFSRRQLHVLAPAKRNIRKNYGSTMSLGIKRGTLVKHSKFGYCLVGGSSKGKLSLHAIDNYIRLTQSICKKDIKIKTNLKYKIQHA